MLVFVIIVFVVVFGRVCILVLDWFFMVYFREVIGIIVMYVRDIFGLGIVLIDIRVLLLFLNRILIFGKVDRKEK